MRCEDMRRQRQAVYPAFMLGPPGPPPLNSGVSHGHAHLEPHCFLPANALSEAVT